MIETTTISVGYDDNEDRIFFDCTDGKDACRLYLTRRITQRLLNAFVELLEKSSPALTKAPADMRSEVIAFEHLSAISQPQPQPQHLSKAAPAASPAAGAGAPVPMPTPAAAVPWVVAPVAAPAGSAVLVHKVDIQITPEAFRLIFYSPSRPVAGLTAIRTDFHKTLAILDQYATAADWRIGGTTEWLKHDVSSGKPGKLAS